MKNIRLTKRGHFVVASIRTVGVAGMGYLCVELLIRAAFGC